MKKILFLVGREFRLFWSNKVFVVAFLGLPIVFSVVMGYVYKKGKVKDLPIVVIDRDHSPASSRLTDILDDNEVLDIVQVAHETVNLKQLMLDTKAVSVVVIPYRFEADLLAQRRPEVLCYLNVSNTIAANAAGGAVNLCATTMNVGIVTATWEKKGIPPPVAMQQYEVFKSNIFLQYNPAGNYLYFLWPAFIFSTLHQLLLLALAVSFSREMDAGTFNRAGLLGYSRSPIVLVLVKVIPYLILSLWTIGVYFSLSRYFQVPLPAHPGLLFLSQLLFVTGAALLGTFFSIVYPLPLKASQTLMSLASPAFTLSGFTWPPEQSPAILVGLSKIIPLTPYLKTMRMVSLQKAGWTDIAPTLQHQLILVAVYGTLAMLLLYVKIRKADKLVIQPVVAV